MLREKIITYESKTLHCSIEKKLQGAVLGMLLLQTRKEYMIQAHLLSALSQCPLFCMISNKAFCRNRLYLFRMTPTFLSVCNCTGQPYGARKHLYEHLTKLGFLFLPCKGRFSIFHMLFLFFSCSQCWDLFHSFSNIQMQPTNPPTSQTQERSQSELDV